MAAMDRFSPGLRIAAALVGLIALLVGYLGLKAYRQTHTPIPYVVVDRGS